MIDLITSEFRYFQMCIMMGFTISMIYDIFRIFRKLLKHNKYVIVIQDILYGFCVGVYIFCVNHKNNSGVIRIFVFVGVLLGIFFYLKFFSDAIVNLSYRLLKKIQKKLCTILIIVEKITINMNIRWKKLSKFRKL